MSSAAAGVVATVHGEKLVGEARYFDISYRPRRWIRLDDRFTKLLRVTENLMLPERRWVRSAAKETPVDLTVIEYAEQSAAGHGLVRFEGQGVELLRAPSRLEDFCIYHELLGSE